jgi:hypothetical protein
VPLQLLLVGPVELLVQSELLELFQDVGAGSFEDCDELVEGLGLFVLEVPLHFLVVAEDAVVVGRLVEVLDDLPVEFLDVDVLVAVEVVLDVLDDLEDDAAGEVQLVVSLFSDHLVQLGEHCRHLPHVLLADALRVQEGKVDQLARVPLVAAHQRVGQSLLDEGGHYPQVLVFLPLLAAA